MVKARKYIVKKLFVGWPQREDFEIVEHDLPPLKDGEILVKVEWISVDPYVRLFNNNPFRIKTPLSIKEVPCDQYGYNIGTVLESKHAHFPVESKVVSHEGWRDYYIVNGGEDNENRVMGEGIYKLPDLQGLPDSLGIGAVGMPGASAYFGFLEVCKPNAGETVVVTSAAGAVGSIVGQIAKIKGCRVIGFTGSDFKVKQLENELGFDKAFNYKTVNITEALKKAAPDGIDCYFDNVGGEISTLIMNEMKPFGRIAVCGISSGYNSEPEKLPLVPLIQPIILEKALTLQGVQVYQWGDRWFDAFEEIIQWIKDGKLKVREHVTEGYENIYDAFIGMMRGDNFGKAVVKI